jgi:hypothetical protein
VSFTARDATSLTIVRFFLKLAIKEAIADKTHHHPATCNAARVLKVSPVALVFRLNGAESQKPFDEPSCRLGIAEETKSQGALLNSIAWYSRKLRQS